MIIRQETSHKVHGCCRTACCSHGRKGEGEGVNNRAECSETGEVKLKCPTRNADPAVDIQPNCSALTSPSN